MTVTAEQAAPAAGTAVPGPLARPAEANWPATMQDQASVWARLSVAPFDTDRPGSHHRTSHPAGLELRPPSLDNQVVGFRLGLGPEGPDQLHRAGEAVGLLEVDVPRHRC